MYYVPEMNASERLTVACAIETQSDDLERVQRLLVTLWDDYFGDQEIPKLSSEWEDINDRLTVIMDIMRDATFELKLAIADAGAVKQLVEAAKRAGDAKAVHDARDAIGAKYKDWHEPEEVLSKIHQAFSLPDKQALPLLQAIAKSAGGATV